MKLLPMPPAPPLPLPAYLRYRLCRAACHACADCGYAWADGTRPYWITR